MNIAYIDFDAFEFEGVDGIYHLIRGCSLVNREELRSRLGLLQERLRSTSEDLTLQELYDQDKYFRHLCHRCLELCGIRLDWVDIDMMMQFLFPYQIEDKFIEGILVRLNFPSRQRQQGKGGKTPTYEEILAALWSHTNDLQKALELAKNMPADGLIETMQARAKQMQDADPQAREKAQKREWQQRARQDLEKGRVQ